MITIERNFAILASTLKLKECVQCVPYTAQFRCLIPLILHIFYCKKLCDNNEIIFVNIQPRIPHSNERALKWTWLHIFLYFIIKSLNPMYVWIVIKNIKTVTKIPTTLKLGLPTIIKCAYYLHLNLKSN